MQDASSSIPVATGSLDTGSRQANEEVDNAGGDKQLPRNEDSAVLKLKGLPYTTVEKQILDFFQGYSVKQISFVYDPDGRPSGLVSSQQSAVHKPSVLAWPAVPRWPLRQDCRVCIGLGQRCTLINTCVCIGLVMPPLRTGHNAAVLLITQAFVEFANKEEATRVGSAPAHGWAPSFCVCPSSPA